MSHRLFAIASALLLSGSAATAQTGFYERFPDDLSKPFDLANSQLVLTPNPAALDGSGFDKTIALGSHPSLPYPNFSTDPGTEIVSFNYQNDFNVAKVWLSNLNFPFAGNSYIGCYIHSNGYIEFKTGTGPIGSLYRDGVGGTIGSSTRDNAFSQFAIYPLWDDLEWFPRSPNIPNLPDNAGTVYYRLINNDRAIITFDRVREITSHPSTDPDDPGPAGDTNANTFQVQLVQGGQIIINWAGITDRTALVGVSLTNGASVPAQSDISGFTRVETVDDWTIF